MSSVVDEFPPPTGFARKYPWDLWCNGQIHVLTRGVDFDCATRRITAAAHRWAERKDMTLRTAVRGDRVWLQFNHKSPTALSTARNRRVA